MSKNCSLVPSAAALDIYLFLSDNKQPSIDQFTQGLVDIIFKEEDVRSDIQDYQLGEYDSKFGEYLKGLISITQSTAVEIGTDDLQADFRAITSQRIIDLIDTLGAEVKSRVKAEEVSVVENPEVVEEAPEVVITETTAEETTTSERAAEPVETVTQSLEDANKSLKRYNVPAQPFAKAYFAKFPDLLTNFESYFINKFYNELINTDSNGTAGLAQGFNGNIDDVMNNLKAKIATELAEKASSLEGVALQDIPNMSQTAQEAYFLSVLDRQFDNVVGIFLPGISIDPDGKVDTGEDGIRRTYASYDGSFSGLDQVSEILKMHVYTTPLVTKNEDGSYTQNELKGYLTNYEVKAIANELNSMPRNLKGFEAALKKKTQTVGPARDIYNSLYLKFFSSNPYVVDGQTKHSLAAIAEAQAGLISGQRLQDIISSFITSFSSMQNLEHFVSEFGKATITRTQNQDVAAILQEDYKNNIANSNDRRTLKGAIADRIEVVETKDGFKIVLGKKFEIEYDLENHNLDNSKNTGVPVNIAIQSKETLEEPTNAARALAILGFPNYLDRKFVDFYKDNIADFPTTAGTGNMDISNMIANIAFVSAMNLPEAREKMHEYGKGFVLSPESASVDPNSVAYQPLDTAWAFRDVITAFAEKTEGVTVKKMRMNGDGNIVAVTGVKSRIYDTANKIQKLTDTIDTIHENNVFVKGNYSLEGWAAKDGMTIRGVRKGNADLSPAEQHKYLMEEAFLKIASQNRFEKALIQPGTMSDRSLVEMAIVKRNANGNDFLPNNWSNRDANGVTPLQQEFIDSQKDFHNAFAQKMLEAWNAQLSLWGMKSDFRSITELQAFLEKEKISAAKAKGSRLVLEANYTIKGDHVQLKDAFLEMHSIWNNKQKAADFSRRMYFAFVNKLRKDGFTPATMSNDAKAIITERLGITNNDTAFHALATSYFYQTNTLSNSLMNINMGSVYQFKGDMDIEAAANSAYMKTYEARLNQRMADGEEGLTKEEVKRKVNVATRQLALDRALNDMFVQQAKRNAGLGSGFQHPRLASSEELGFLMGEHTTTVLIEDTKENVKILGDLRGDLGQEVYDAVMMAHPLYFIKLNNSLGNENSGFVSKGGAVKDISNEVDPVSGIVRFQKKATFNQFSHELLRNGTPELSRLFRKMNSVPFKDFGAPDLVYDGQTFTNLQQLWEYFGATNEADSWERVAEVLGNSPAHRMAYIEKVGFKSGEKTGNRHMNTADVWKKDKGPGSKMKWTEFSNEHHGVILNPDHDPDSTHTTESEKSLMTQVISAIVFQGESADVAAQVNDALLSLSESGLTLIEDEINRIATRMIAADARRGIGSSLTLDKRNEVITLLETALVDPKAEARLQELIDTNGYADMATSEWVRKTTEDAVRKQETFGIVSDLISKDMAAMDTMQLQAVVHRSIMSKLNKATTKMKFNGQEFVVSASFDFNKLYTIPGSNRVVTRSEFMNSSLVEFKPVNKAQIAQIIDTDIVSVNGEEMPMWEAVRNNGGDRNIPGLEAKIPTDGRALKWIGYFDKDGKSVEEYPEYIALTENTDPAKHNALELKLSHLMNDASKGWTAEDAEFFMPMMHLKAFNLDDASNVGEPGSYEGEPISISTIMGDSQGGGTLWFKNGERVDSPSEGAYSVSGDEFEHMKEFFMDRIEEHEDTIDPNGKRRYDFTHFDEVSIENAGDYKATVTRLERRMSTLDPRGLEYKYLKEQYDGLTRNNEHVLEAADDTPLPSTVTVTVNDIRGRQKIAYLESLAEKQAASFPKTLEMIAARIPAQGKQSYISGRVKGFITSNRNALYGAPEMLTITGADHDIDKSHVLVYSVQADGSLYSYKEYLEGDKISKAKFDKDLEAKIKQKTEILTQLGKKPGFIRNQIEALKKKETKYFQEATKNFILDKIRQSVRDPRNAVEAATPVSMGKLQDALAAKEGGEIDIDEDGGVIIGGEDNFIASPFNPASIPNLEIVNTVGKQLVGVNATGLKGYAASFYAWLDDMDSPYIKFGSETQRLFDVGKGVPQVVQQVFEATKFVDKEGNEIDTPFEDASLNLYLPHENGRVRRISRRFLANSNKFSSEEKENENVWRAKQDQWLAEGKTQEEVDELLATEGAYLLDSERKLEPQAWEDISELLSAATDNAKELLLGRLGINKNTNGFVVAGIIAGFDLTDVLTLLNDSDVKAIIKKVNDSNDLVKGDGRFTTLKRELENYVKDNFKYLASNVEGLANTVAHTGELRKAKTLFARAIKSQAGDISSIDEANIHYASESHQAVSDVTSVENPAKAPSVEEEAELQAFLGDHFSRVDLSRVNSILASIKGANTIIITPGLPKGYQVLVENYANSLGQPVFKLQDGDTWRVLEGGEYVRTPDIPVIGAKTALITGQKITRGKQKLLDAAVANTRMALENPSEFNSITQEKNAERDASFDEAQEKLQQELDKFLTNGPRQVLQLLKIASENRAITALLAINQSIPNSDWDGFNYINKFLAAVNQNLPDEAPKFTHQDVDDFVKSVSSGEMGKATEIIERYEANKVAINPFHVLAQNKHYFGYIKSFLFAKEKIKKSTFTNGVIEDIIHNHLDPTNIKDEVAYGEVKNFVYGMGIEKFFKHIGGDFTIKGNTFNLASSKGRADFLNAMYNISQEMKNDPKISKNPFMMALKTDTLRDAKLDDFLNIIRTLDLNRMTEIKKSQVQLGLEQLRSLGGDYKVFHDALFYYSLILNKGSRGSKSFSALFDPATTPALKNYAEFLKNNKTALAEDIKKSVEQMGSVAIQLSVPSSIKEVSTMGATSMVHDGEVFRVNRVDRGYILPGKHRGNVLKSRETKKIYMWAPMDDHNGNPMKYVVITAKRPLKAIPYSGGEFGIESAGFQFGETAKIDSEENGETVQVLKWDYSDELYVVQKQNGAISTMSAEDLAEHNPDMVFLKNKFGKISVEDAAKENFKRTATDEVKEKWNIRLNAPTQEQVFKGNTKYRIINPNMLPDGTQVGDVIGSTVLTRHGYVRAKLRYIGSATNEDEYSHIWMGLDNSYDSRRFKSGESGQQYIVAYEKESTPEMLEEAGVVVDYNAGARIGIRTRRRIYSQKANHFASNAELNIEEGDTKLLKFEQDGKKAWFKVTNEGHIDQAITNISDLHIKLGYGTNGHSLVESLISSGDKTIYSVEPYNAKGASTDSHTEYRFLSDDITPNLSDVKIVTIGNDENTANAMLRGEAKAFGVPSVESERLNILTDFGLSIKSKVEENSDLFGEAPAVKNEEINAIMGSDMVVVIDDWTSEGNAKQRQRFKAAGLTAARHLSVEEQKLVDALYATNEEEEIQKLSDLKEVIAQGRLGERIKEFSGVTNNITKLKALVNNAYTKLTTESDIPAELRNVTNLTTNLVQAAKYSGKPTYIYSPSRQQWFKYTTSGEFAPVAIPVVEGIVAMFNHNLKDPIAKQGVDSLLKKTSAYKKRQLHAAGNMRTIKNITFGDGDINEEINAVVETDSVQALDAVPSVTDFDQDEKNDAGNNYVQYTTLPSGEKVYEHEYTSFENAEVKQLADGTITIESTTEFGRSFFWAYFPDAKVKKEEYRDIEGDVVKKNFRVEIDGVYYTFNELHRMDKEAFARRDQLLGEKTQLKAMFDDAQAYADEVVSPIYAAVRYSSVETAEKFKNYVTLDSFMLHMNSGNIEVDPELAEQLNEAYNTLVAKKKNAWDYFRKVREENTEGSFEYSSTSESFYDKERTNDDVVVFLTDTDGNHANVDVRVKDDVRTRIQPTGKGKKGKYGAQRINKDLRGFAVPVASVDRSGKKRAYVRAQQHLVNKSVQNLVKLARKEQDKKFYVELPVDMVDAAYGQVSGKQAMLTLSKAFESVSGSIPSNIIFTNGGLKSLGVSRNTPFTVTNDATDLDTFDIDYYSVWNQKIGEATLASLWNLERGYPVDVDPKSVSLNAPALKGSDAYGMNEFQAFKNLWRRWAEANPRKFEKLARDIGNRGIFDPYHSEKTKFSVGRALSELLTEAYVNISWIDYPRSTVNTTAEIEADQTVLPLENFELVQFNKEARGGKSLLTVNGKTYIATIEKMRNAPEDRTNVSLVAKLGLESEENPIQKLDAKYPFMKSGNFITVSLSEFKGEINDAKPQQPGYFSDVLERSGVKVSPEHMALAEKATAVIGIDTRAKITDSVESAMSGTHWIKEYKKSMGNALLNSPSTFDAVWIYGSKLEDGNNPETIKKTLDAAKILVDKVAKSGAEILVGKGSGIEEEIRSYIMSTYTKYQPTETGFAYNSEYSEEYNPAIGQNGQLFKTGKNVGRFNSNNTLNREGVNLTGAWGTVLYTSAEAAKDATGKEQTNSYTVNIKENENKDWNKRMDTAEVMAMIDEIYRREDGESYIDSTPFESIRGTLLVTEQRFMRHLIATSLMTKYKVDTSLFYNTGDIDAMVDKMMNKEDKAYDPEFAKEYQGFYDRMFNSDGTFRVSDVGSLAMSRNRNITISYAKEMMPELFERNFENKPVFEFINAERKAIDRGRGYFALINDPSISASTLKLISDSKQVTYRDAYNLLKSLGTDKIIGKGNVISGDLVNKLFVAKGIKAFSNGDTVVVLDNDAINHKRSGKMARDFDKKPAGFVENTIEKDLAKMDKRVYRFLKSKGMLKADPYAKTVRVLINGEVRTYETDRGDLKQLITDVRTEIAMTYFGKFEGVTFTPDYMTSVLKNTDFRKIRNLVDNHIKYGRSVKGDNFSMMFFGQADEDLPTSTISIVPGKVYTAPNGLKAIVMRDANGQWFAQSVDGKLYKLFGSKWVESEGINNRDASFQASLILSLASPKGVGQTFDSLALASGEQLKNGEFEVTRNSYTEGSETVSETLATDHNTGTQYRWEALVDAWAPIETPAFMQTEADADANPTPGSKVLALPLVGGNNIRLDNGVAVSENLVRDDRGEYLKGEDGVWKQTKSKGGFTNPDVKFQKDETSFTDSKGQKLASKKVSNDTMRSVFTELFKNTQVEAELLSAEDIRTIYGNVYANASGFVKNGRVVINLDKATLDTPLHEFGGHIYLAHLKATNPEAYTEVVDKTLGHDIAEQIAAKYPELNSEELGEEVFSTLFGLANQHKLSEQSLTKWERIRKIANEASSIGDFFRNAFKVVFGTDADFELDLNDSLMTIIDKLGNNIIFGDKSVLNNLTTNQIEDLKTAMNPVKSQEDIQKKLEELGYIQKICR